MTFIKEIEIWNQELSDKDIGYVINYFTQTFPDKVVFSSSLSVEDQVITHVIATEKLPVKIFTLDTLRLFPETYELIEQTKKHYSIDIEIYKPDAEKVRKMVESKGYNLFYESIENRKLCCSIRKKEPLQKALQGMKVWITGLRREQSEYRADINLVEWDSEHNIIKINPLYNWTETQLWEFIRKNHIPYNPLHDKNYKSIGCEPCTRALKPGENIRAGRWWWEHGSSKECGLHEK